MVKPNPTPVEYPDVMLHCEPTTADAVCKDAAPRLGEPVTVVGFPLVNVLGARPSVGFGNVPSTVGIRGNPSQMQISVPIQRGASGGPVLDQSANVIGVVVSKLDALKLAERLGDLAQNVNFAVRGAAVTVRVRCLRESAPAPAPANRQQ